jgi:hypothetical protein
MEAEKSRASLLGSKNMDTFREESVRRTGMSWSAVFAGTFVFLSIEATFGALAVALFPSGPTAGILGPGPGVWMIVLSIIALYFGGRAAAHLSGEFRRLDGMYYGLVTFGLSILASVLMAVMIAGNTANAAALPATIAANAVWLFVTLILSGIAAGIGGALGVPERIKGTAVREPPKSIRSVA